MEQFSKWWNHIPEHLKPVIAEIGPFQLRYYGLMYLVGFVVVYLLVSYRLSNESFEYSKGTIQTYFVWAILGVLIGGKLGYILFYQSRNFPGLLSGIMPPFRLANLLRYASFGMSYHGGVIGVVLVSVFFCHKHKINFWHFADFFSPAIPLGFSFGRIGNFINGELYGRVTTLPWGMYFPLDSTRQLRHPSQLYEAFFEGVFLFIILWSLRKIKYFDGFLFSLYLIGYGSLRFLIEFVREPDVQLGLIFGPLTMGQILSAAMIVGGMFIILIKRSAAHAAAHGSNKHWLKKN